MVLEPQTWGKLLLMTDWEIITYDRLGNYYLKEIILRHARNLAPLQPSFKFAAQHPFHLNRSHLFMSLQTLKKKKRGSGTSIHP